MRPARIHPSPGWARHGARELTCVEIPARTHARTQPTDQQHKKNAAKEKGEQYAILPPTSGSCARPPKPDFDNIATTQTNGQHGANHPANAAARHTAGMKGVVHELAQDTARMAIASPAPGAGEVESDAGASASTSTRTRTSISTNTAAAGPGKTSLASLAAASKAAKPSLASLAKAKVPPAASNANGTGIASPSLSKLAAKAQSRQAAGPATFNGARVGQPPTSSSSTNGVSGDPAPSAATNVPKLSKLQQRILAGGVKPAASAPPMHPDAPAAPMDEVEEDQLPSSSLFAATAPPAPPSGFASALIPEHHPAFDAVRARDLASRERTKGIALFDKPSPDDLAVQTKKAGIVLGRGMPAKR